jgi:hypothetical protein
MTEIKIERKKKPVWPWLLLLVIVALLGWVIYEFALKNEQAYLPAAQTTVHLAFLEHHTTLLHLNQV